MAIETLDQALKELSCSKEMKGLWAVSSSGIMLLDLGGIPLTAKVKIEAIDDAEKSIAFAVLEGDVLQLYKSFNATLVVSGGLAKWTFTFEKATLISPIPELYGPLAIAASTLVDAYLLINN